MGIIYNKSNFLSFSSEPSLRFDYLFNNNIRQISSDFYTYKDLFDIIDYEKLDISTFEVIKYAEIGNVTKKGKVEPVELDFDNRNELNKDLFNKIEKGDIIKPKKGDILLSAIRPYLNKNVLINNESIFFTKAFIQIRPKINSTIFYHTLRNIFFKNLNSVSRQGKGYPTLKTYDLKTIRFPKNTIDALIENENKLLSIIKPLEQEIKDLQVTKKEPLDIINEVFAKEFDINLQAINRIENKKIFKTTLKNTSFRNSNIRNSVRWNKIQELQNVLYEKINCIDKLSNHIVSTKNGWSPSSQEGGIGTPILGQEHFNHKGKLVIKPTKTTKETRANIKVFYIKEDDFFVSRGNTIDLVALASIVKEKVDEHILYPDLYIKIDFVKNINKDYIAYVFNSLFGRLYFKYVSKGKNQTMVKISSIELNNFYLPIPKTEKQDSICETIKAKLDAQKLIDKQIEQKQNKISKLIEKTITENANA